MEAIKTNMQVVPGNAFQNTVSGAAAVPQSSPQPAADPQARGPVHAVKGAGRSHPALSATQQRPNTPTPANPQQQGQGAAAEFRPNAPRGSVLDIMV